MKEMNNKETIVQLHDVSFHYVDGKTVLEHISFDLKRGDFLGIVGPNGSGKSTLMRIILGLLAPSQGRVELFGQPLSAFRDWPKVGYVSQQVAHGVSGFPATVREVVTSGLVGKVGLFRRIGKAHQAKVEEVIERVGLAHKTDDRISNLSGGQLQRVFIARGLVADPQLLILDEPTVGVDQESIEQFYSLLRSLKEDNNMTMMMVNHDVSVMTQWVNKVACLHKTLHFHGTPDDFVHNEEKIMASMYGQGMRILAHHH